jgi:hypothetical protein
MRPHIHLPPETSPAGDFSSGTRRQRSPLEISPDAADVKAGYLKFQAVQRLEF